LLEDERAAGVLGLRDFLGVGTHLENVFGHGGGAVGAHEREEVIGRFMVLDRAQRTSLVKRPELSANSRTSCRVARLTAQTHEWHVL
jgi:hypothetical protein